MKPDEIKDECEKLYSLIRGSQKRLEELRDMCKHEKTYIGKYSYRIGVADKMEICIYCGEPIKLLSQ